MVFGILKDIKEGENRVICTPVEVASIRAAGHTVLVQSGAGVGSGFPMKVRRGRRRDRSRGAEMWQRCDFLAKVKEIEPSEFGLPREGQMLYCCVHPAGHPEEVDALLKASALPSPPRTATATAPPTARQPASRARCSVLSPC